LFASNAPRGAVKVKIFSWNDVSIAHMSGIRLRATRVEATALPTPPPPAAAPQAPGGIPPSALLAMMGGQGGPGGGMGNIMNSGGGGMGAMMAMMGGGQGIGGASPEVSSCHLLIHMHTDKTAHHIIMAYCSHCDRLWQLPWVWQ